MRVADRPVDQKGRAVAENSANLESSGNVENSVTVENNIAEQRYEIFVDGDLAGYSAYRSEPGQIVFTHTTIEPDYGGQGVGSALARAAIEDVRGQGLRVVARCPFIAAYLQRHPEYQNA